MAKREGSGYTQGMEKPAKSPILLTALIALAVPLVYVLSVGPLALYYEKSHTEPQAWVLKLYAPIDWAWKEPALRPPLEAYIEFWRKLGH